MLTTELKFDEHTLNSSLDPDELSRLEFEPEHLALIFKRPKSYSASDRYFFRVNSLGVFLFTDRIIIVTSEDFPIFDNKKFARIKSLKDVMLTLLYRSIYHDLEHLKVINLISGELEEKIYSSMENKNLLNLFTLEKSMVYYLNAINANSMMLQKLKNNSNIITICIMVPTFVVSAFSMNVGIPLARNPIAFWIIMSMAVISMVGFLLFWRFKRW
jgi:magnesium transporter